MANLLCATLGCQGAAAPSSPAARAAPRPHELVIDGVQLERWIEGQLRYSARAEQAVVDRKSGVVAATAVEVTARAPGGAERGRLRGRTLAAQLDGRAATLTEEVVFEDAEGRTLTATAAELIAAEDRVRAPGVVVFEGANFRATGRRLEADLKRGTIDVAGPLDARITP